MDIANHLSQGREAFGRREWQAARDGLSAPDLTDLDPADLHALATAAYLVGDTETSVRALQQSFEAHTGDDAPIAAARDALSITSILTTSGNAAAAHGWKARAARLLEAVPDDVAEHGFLQMQEMLECVFTGRVEEAQGLAVEVVEAGHRHGEPDLVSMGLVCQGRMSIYRGRVPEGLALLDEAMVAVTSGEVSSILAGRIYCVMIDACQELDDYRRMTDWTRMLTHWCAQQPDLVRYTGQSAVHRAQIMRIQGAWSDALDELDLAQDRYERQDLDPAVGQVHYERGEVRRLQGDFDAADECYAAAGDQGHDPQPGLTQLWLALGRTDAAAAAVRRLLEETVDPVHRSRLLPTAVEVYLAVGDVEAASIVVDELEGLATSFGSAALTAAAAYARGRVLSARDDPSAALPHLRTAWRGWLDLGARYDAARARMAIGEAFRAMDDEDSAAAELTVAGRTFQDLGAVPAARGVERLLAGATHPDGLTAREVEVLRLVAAGKTNHEIATQLVLSEKTVARHLSNIFGKTSVTSRTAAAAYAFQHQLA